MVVLTKAVTDVVRRLIYGSFNNLLGKTIERVTDCNGRQILRFTDNTWAIFNTDGIDVVLETPADVYLPDMELAGLITNDERHLEDDAQAKCTEQRDREAARETVRKLIARFPELTLELGLVHVR